MEKKTHNLLNSFVCTTTFICSLMVVGIHQYNAGTLDRFSVTALVEGFLAHGIFIAAVPCFFILSGFLFFRNTNQINDVYKKQIKRIKSVLIPFLAWSAFYCLLNYIKRFVLGEDIVFNIFRFIKEVAFYIHCFSLWYMFQLIVYIILSPAIFLILKNKKASLFILLVLSIVGMIYNPVISISVVGKGRGLFQVSFFAYYFIGCIAAKHFEPKKMIELVNKIPMSIIHILLVVFGIIQSLIYDEIIVCFNKRCLVPLVAALVLILILKLCLQGNCLNNLPFGISTMMIYGIHPFVGMVLVRFINMIPINHFVLFIVQYILVVATSYTASFVIKKTPPLYKVLSGNR